MPRLEKVGLRQTAVLWAFYGHDQYGQTIVASPVEINVRYEEALRLSIQADASPIAKDAVIDVDRDIAQGSLIRLGTLASVPSPPTNIVEVVSMDKIPDIKGRHFQRSVNVTRWKDVLPTTTTTTTGP